MEVVVAGAADLPAMIAPEVEGVYVVGTGGTGAAQTFFTLGIVYFLIMLVAASCSATRGLGAQAGSTVAASKHCVRAEGATNVDAGSRLAEAYHRRGVCV